MQRSLIALACAACAAIAAAPAVAHAQTWRTAQVRVSLSDLDLDTAAGAETVLARLDRAATRACGDRPMTGTMETGAVQRFERCRRTALGRAVDDLDAPLVTSLLEIRHGKVRLLASR